MARYYNAFSIKSLLIDLMLLKDSRTKDDIGNERKRINVACPRAVDAEKQVNRSTSLSYR